MKAMVNLLPAKLGSLMNYMYKHTTFNREAGTGHIISNCEIYNTGSGELV